MVEMTVYGLALDESSQVPILILRDTKEQAVLPIWIGALEAMAISLVLNSVDLPRPLTHDLLLRTITALGAEVVKVSIVDLREGTYYAEITIVVGGRETVLDSRPSDAVALALRAKVPIFVAQTVLDQVVQDKEHYQAVLDGDDEEKWAEILKRFSPEDLKYKM